MTEEIFSNISSNESLDNDLTVTAARNEERDGVQIDSNADGNRSAPQDGRSRWARRINEMGNMHSRQIALNASLESDRSNSSSSLSSTRNPNITTATTRVLALCCFVCSTPIATASDLLPDQIARLETASYPYKLDLLLDDTETEPSTSMIQMSNINTNNGGECWVYSATNPDGTRFDVVRFGNRACQRVRVQDDEPTLDHTFFPPYAWSMASCRNCGVHLGWSFGGGNNDDMNETINGRELEGDSFLGLILTKLRERRIDATVLEHGFGET